MTTRLECPICHTIVYHEDTFKNHLDDHEKRGDKPAIAPPPLCPHCSEELTGIGLYHWQHQMGVILAIFCATCRKPLHFEAIPVVQQQEQPRIARPS